MEKLNFWMGQTPIQVDEIPPGNLFGFHDPNLISYKTAYIAPDSCPNLLPVLHEQSLIKVQIRAKYFEDTNLLKQGLKFLNMVDPVVDVICDEKGNLQLMANGEIHLERCLRDLKMDYFGKEIIIDDILIEYKETVINSQYVLNKEYDNAIQEIDEGQFDEQPVVEELKEDDLD